VLDHRAVENGRQPPALRFGGDPRVVDLDDAILDLAVGHDGFPAYGEFTMGRRFRVFNLHVIEIRYVSGCLFWHILGPPLAKTARLDVFCWDHKDFFSECDARMG